MPEFIQHLLNGFSLGAIYALIALGYTLVYGILKLINFAHGEIFMVSAFTALFASQALNASAEPALWKFFAILLLAMLLASVLGITIERFAYRPLRGAPRINLLITAVGVSLLLQNLGQVIFGASPRVFPTILPQQNVWQWGELLISNHFLLVLCTSLGLMLALEALIKKTKLGRAMRAVAHSHENAALLGISVNRVITFTFIVGSSLAAAGAVLYGIMYPRVDPLMGVLPGIKAFVAAVLGGIGNVRGAVAGALIMGVAEVMVVAYFIPTWRDALAFAILIIILILKPAGLLGKFAPEKV
jgi:branched-chain amino acid transport system permease protein